MDYQLPHTITIDVDAIIADLQDKINSQNDVIKELSWKLHNAAFPKNKGDDKLYKILNKQTQLITKQQEAIHELENHMIDAESVRKKLDDTIDKQSALIDTQKEMLAKQQIVMQELQGHADKQQVVIKHLANTVSSLRTQLEDQQSFSYFSKPQ